jgi:diguanylate cyclase (GGDEF)-like protein/PAS domain S-box-containing protein
MLAYHPGVEVVFDGRMALLSVVAACAVATAGWLVAFHGAVRRPLLGGLLVGAALVLAHFLDMAALRVAGDVSYDGDLIAASLAGGLLLCAGSAYLLAAQSSTRLPLLPSLVMAGGVLVLHFVAMAAVSIAPTGIDPTVGLPLGISEVSALVIIAAIAVLLTALGLAQHDRRIMELTAQEARRLQEVVLALRQSEEHHRFSVLLNPQIPWIGDPDGQISEVGPRWSEIVGAPASSALGDGWKRWLHADDLPPVDKVWREAVASGGRLPVDTQYRLKLSDGSYRWFRTRARARRDERGNVVKWYGTLEDIHEKVTAEESLRKSEERYRLASRATKDIIWDWWHDTEVLHWSDAIETALGYPEAKAGTSLQWWIDRIHPEDRDGLVTMIDEVIRGTSTHWSAEYRVRSANGSYLHMLARGHMVRSPEGLPVRSVGAMMDITESKRLEATLRRAAYHDHLTGLPNRALFTERLVTAFAESKATGCCVGLVTLDLDCFRSLNDALGHVAGDAVLRAASARLSGDVPPGATVARLGGDEFAIILPGLQPDETHVETIERILIDREIPLSIDGRNVTPSFSAGVAFWPADGADAENLLKSADLALSDAKAAGPGTIRSFNVAMRDEVERQATMLRDARLALAEDRVVPFYQPKICLRTGAVVGMEALLRWHRPGEDVLPPSALAAALEDAGLAVQLTDRMLAKVVDDIARWLDEGLDPGRVAINGSAGDFAKGAFAERILNVLRAKRVDPSRLELEVTETVFLGQPVLPVKRALQTLSDAGVTIALDDFGTGYASLAHLQQFPVHTLKIDQSFVSRMPSETSDAAIVGAVIDLARRLGKMTVAEGIETELQARLLAGLGCDVGQGYLFGRPTAAAGMEATLRAKGRSLELGCELNPAS